jgi:integrase
MAKKHTDPYRLYLKREIYYAYISFTRQDGQQFYYRGTTGTRNRAEAERWVIEKINNFYKEKPSNNELPKLTFEDACVLFYERHGQYLSKPISLLHNLNNIKKQLNVTYLTDITPQVITQMVDARKKQVANATINRDLMVISSIINKCDLWGYEVPKIKLSKFKLKEKAENVKYLDSWETAQKIIDNAQDHLKPIIYTALYTGLRKGNLLNLKWENLDFKNNTINIKVKDKNKDGGKNLSIPMIDKLKEILQALPKESEYVFTYKNDRIKDIKKSWHTALEKAEIPYTNFHTLRHTCATWLLKKTGNLKLTQQVLGHADIKTTVKYAHVLDDEKRNALEEVFN